MNLMITGTTFPLSLILPTTAAHLNKDDAQIR
jgi:hypothetical protein